MAVAINAKDKAAAAPECSGARQLAVAKLLELFPDKSREIANELEEIEYRVMRAQVLEKGERVDGRDLDTIRPITIEVGVLPRTHGSALFTRGETQALVSVTLGTTDDEQRIDSIDVAGETTKSFMLHYNFPPFSTGEVKMMRGTSRREIGHGALAERALQPLLPHFEDFRVHRPRGVGHSRIQRFVVDGDRLRRLARADGCRRADQGALRRCGDGPDQGRRQGRHPHRHPRHRGPSRRHGLQGGRHREGHHLDPDGHQDRGPRSQDHGGGAGEGPEGPLHPGGWAKVLPSTVPVSPSSRRASSRCRSSRTRSAT